MTPPDPNPNKDMFDALRDIGDVVDESVLTFSAQANAYWDSLSYEQKLFAFFSVCKRLHKGEIEDQGSYRYVLYNVFGFGLDAYLMGIECGFMDIHDAIDGPNPEQHRRHLKSSFDRVTKQYAETLQKLEENERKEQLGSEEHGESSAGSNDFDC